MLSLDILVLSAHPDDTELCCGGTLAALVQQGKKVGVIDMTRGEKGSRGTPEQRLEEAQKAAKIIGLEHRENLRLTDTGIQNTRANQKKIISKIRAFQPHVCIVGAPFDRHPDHGHATQLALDAIFYSGLIKIVTQDENGQSQDRWRPSHVLHFMQDRAFEPDIVFDISDTFDIKQQAIRAFDSQFEVQDPGDQPETYISGKRFFKGIEARARHYGHLIGATYGEPFKYQNGPIPFGSFAAFFETKPER